jgi:hypothetical protein
VSTPYQVVSVDLTIARVLPLVGPANAITSFTILAFPGGVSFIRLGQNGQRIPVVDQMKWDYDPCFGPENEGLIWEQPVAGAGVASIIIFMGGGSVGLGT